MQQVQLPSQRQFWFWGITFALFLLLLYVLRDALLPFVAGLALAYLLDPIASRLERLGMSRTLAVLLILGIAILVIILLAVTLVPVLMGQLSNFVTRVPALATQFQVMVSQQLGPLLERVGIDSHAADLQTWISQLSESGAQWIGTVLKGVLSGGKSVIDAFSLLFIAPVVAFYVLIDWHKMLERIDHALPRTQVATIRKLAGEIDDAVAGYVRGQSLVCLFLATFYGIGLSLTGLNFGLLIGILSGVFSFIPFVGSLAGLIVALIMALVQFSPDWISVAAVAGVFGVGQFIEGNVLSPKLVGSAVGLHPVWLMFALFAFGSLAGFVGMLVAVPLAAAVAVLVRHAISLYLESTYYIGHKDQERSVN